jgi:myo-inositol 2-dehydrogenase / D-chiro-inositol 1-dehydrogenase
MTLRIAIAGAGRMGRERARAANLLGAKIHVICDFDFERAVTLAAEFGARALASTETLDLTDVDALFVCTPPACRGELELAAIQSGVPLFVEKPIGLNTTQCRPLMDALSRSPVINAAGYMNRYRRSVLSAREQIQNSVPIGASFQWFAAKYRVPWWLQRDQSGGPINEQCTHYIDLCRFLLGEISEVQSIGRALPDAPDAEGTIAMTLRFENGLIGSGLYSCEASQKQMAFEVLLPERSVRLQGWDLHLDQQLPAEDIFLKEVRAFFEAVQSGDPSTIRSDIRSALRTQNVIDTICRSLETGAIARVPEFEEELVHS